MCGKQSVCMYVSRCVYEIQREGGEVECTVLFAIFQIKKPYLQMHFCNSSKLLEYIFVCINIRFDDFCVCLYVIVLHTHHV